MALYIQTYHLGPSFGWAEGKGQKKGDQRHLPWTLTQSILCAPLPARGGNVVSSCLLWDVQAFLFTWSFGEQWEGCAPPLEIVTEEQPTVLSIECKDLLYDLSTVYAFKEKQPSRWKPLFLWNKIFCQGDVSWRSSTKASVTAVMYHWDMKQGKRKTLLS